MRLNFAIMKPNLGQREITTFEEELQWSYSGFNRFRERLYVEIGGGELKNGFDTNFRDHKSDSLIPLLDHSDCDGTLDKRECNLIAPRLKEIVMWWDIQDYDRVSGLRLVKMMNACKVDEFIQFC